MTEPRDLRELVGDDVSASELEALRRADALLRSVPAPPAEVPPSLSRAVLQAAEAPGRLWTRRRTAVALAFAAALSALFFGLGSWTGGRDDFDARATVRMSATENAPGARATIRMGHPDESGNWPLRLEASGLRDLPPGGYYVLWLAKDGDYGATCGSFRVDDGDTEVEWDVSYRLAGYDKWVITAYLPDEPEDLERPWLLQAKVSRA
jgi:hypothetical protein